MEITPLSTPHLIPSATISATPRDRAKRENPKPNAIHTISRWRQRFEPLHRIITCINRHHAFRSLRYQAVH